MKPTKIMLDLETLSTRPGGVIISIGATKFDENGPYGEPFYMRINPKSSMDAGFLIEADTILWWMRQSDEARAEFQKESHHVFEVMSKFSVWCDSPYVKCVGHIANPNIELWGNGANFDNAILKAAYDKLGLNAPWEFYNDRCYRTMKAMYPHIKMPKRVGTHHNALDDAISQVNHLILFPCFQELCAAENQAAADAQQLKLEGVN